MHPIVVLPVVVLAVLLFFPRKLSGVVPRLLLGSRVFNVGLTVLLALATSVMVLAVAHYSTVKRDDGILFGFYFLLCLAAAAVAVPAFLYSYLGLFQSHDTRNA